VQDRRALTSLVLGIAGAVAGLAGLALNQDPLALIAGALAAGAGTVTFLGRPTTPVDPGPPAAAPPTGADVAAGAPPAADNDAQPAPSEAATTTGPQLDEPAMAPRTDVDGLVDAVTGLYSESYLMVALDARIAAARRRLRPVSVVMIDVVYGLHAGNPVAADPTVVAAAVRTTLREADTASRLNDGRFVLVLEDTPENGAIWTVERLRSYLVSDHPDHTVWAGIACYPAHAFNLEEIMQQAEAALGNAREWRQDRIEVAASEA